MTNRLRSIREHRGLGRERGMTRFSKLPILNMGLLCAIAVALITLITLSNPEPAQETHRPRLAQGQFGARIASFAFSPTGTAFATTNDAGRVTLRAPERGVQIERCLKFPGFARDIAFSPDGRSFAAIGIEPGISLWDLSFPGNEPFRTVMVPMQEAKRVMFSPDGRTIAVTSFLDGIIILWDVATRRERMAFHQLSPVEGIAFSPDGRGLATGGTFDRSILIWDLPSGARRLLQEGNRGGVTTALAFSPDGAQLASAGFPEHHVRLWDVKTGRVCRLFEGHSHPVNSLAFSPDGSLLATASNDGTLGLWTVATGQRRISLDSQASILRTVVFSPDGQSLLLATGDDDDVRLWQLAELFRAHTASNSARR
jgi:WD40 repeat protein